MSSTIASTCKSRCRGFWQSSPKQFSRLSAAKARSCSTRSEWQLLQFLRQEPHQPRRQKSRIAPRLLDRVVHPVVRRALDDTWADEEARELERQLERIGMRLAVDQIVLGAGCEQHGDLVVGKGRIIDRRGVEIKLPVFHQ